MITEHSAITEPVHRLEVFPGRGRRRRWSEEDKARIVAEIITSGDSVSGVARRHGLSPQQLFGWRRQLQSTQVVPSKTAGLQFVPVVAAAPASAPVRRQRRRAPWSDAEPDVGLIEVEIAGVTVRIGRGAEAETVTAVLRALKACA
jgi:transposase